MEIPRSCSINDCYTGLVECLRSFCQGILLECKPILKYDTDNLMLLDIKIKVSIFLQRISLKKVKKTTADFGTF